MAREKTDENGLTKKQALFVAAYKGNANEAARQAGYSEKSLSQNASLCLRSPAVQRALSKKLERESEPLIRDKRARLKWLVGQLKSKKLKIGPKLKIYELLAKSCGDFVDGNIQPPPGGNQPPPTVIVIKAGKESPVQVNIGGELPTGEELPVEVPSGEELPVPDGDNWPVG
jgi:hypothetical protein